MLRYLPEVAIGVVVGHEKNMKVTEPIDVYIADKLFQLTSADQPEALTDAEYRSRLEGRTVVVFGGSYGIGGDIAELARSHGAIVKVFSRSTTNTHVERREDLVLAARQVIEETGAIDFVVNTAGVLPRGELAEASEEQVLQATDVNYLAPIYIEQEFYPHLAASKGSLLLFTSSSYTRGRSGYALYPPPRPRWSTSPRPSPTNGRRAVAQRSLDVLLSVQTGHIIDIRRDLHGQE